MAGKYYIRFRGRRAGPLTVEMLHSLAKRGRFGRHYEVSLNGRDWELAVNFPELFDDGLDDPQGFGEEDHSAPLVDQNARGGGRRRRKSRSQSDDAEFTAPPYADPYGENPEPPKAKRRSQRDVDDDDQDLRDSIPLADSDDSIPVDEEFGELQPTRTKRKTAKAARKTDALIAPEDDLPPDADSDNAKTGITQKKPGGFFGLFRRKGKPPEELSPHLDALHRMSDRLGSQKFALEDIVLVGSRRQELPVVGRHDEGEGIQTLGLLTMIAYQTRSTDIHLEPKADGFEARMRIDGMLVPIVDLPKSVANRVAGVVKVLCEMEFAGQLGIQEGSYSAVAPDRHTDYRVSFTPSVHGQKLAIRVLDVANSPQSIDGLGAPKAVVSRLKSVMQQNAGMILMCGPTGSGKTTTLYSLIRGIDRKTRNVMTIEDPVEYKIEDVTQSSVDAERGKNFSDMLRALLRQDPDVLLLGEIRDSESAKIAMQATMTGHLVLSTVHAPDTLNTIFRLLDLGADPNMVASSLDLVLAQRLVRVLCTHCKKRRRPNGEELKMLGRSAREMIYTAAGCDYCLGTGFSGRCALFELLATNERLNDVLLKSPTLRRLKVAVQDTGFRTLRDHGHQLVAEGVTTFSEIHRVVGDG